MNQKETKSPAGRSKGAILLLTTILLFVLLGMVVSLSYVTVMEQKMSSKTKSSVASFYNSESGIEWALNQIATKTGTISSAFSGKIDATTGKVTCPDFGSGNNCDVYLLDSDGKVINNSNPTVKPGDTNSVAMVKAVRSVGSQGGETQRAIEAAVASGGGGCYVQHLLEIDIGTGKRCPVNTSDGCCASGFSNKAYLGAEGTCKYGNDDTRMTVYVPPAGYDSINSLCNGASDLMAIYFVGRAYVCCL